MGEAIKRTQRETQRGSEAEPPLLIKASATPKLEIFVEPSRKHVCDALFLVSDWALRDCPRLLTNFEGMERVTENLF